MDTCQFDYPLPPSRIAQFPTEDRTASRLLVTGDENRPCEETRFSQISTLLKPGDVLVANDTRVIPARLKGRKPTGGNVEIMLERIVDSNSALVQMRASKPIREQQIVLVGHWELVVVERRDSFFIIALRDDGNSIDRLFTESGQVPLPPYIDRDPKPDDDERYQTVYSTTPGAVAAPTAGLHFNQALIDQLTSSGIHWATVTLHVGAGTFQPMRSRDLNAHKMHSEQVVIDQVACDQINLARSQGGRVVSVGTTVVRALESAAISGQLKPFCGDTDLFIVPGFEFKLVDVLVTNFHLPRSTLLMMVCAFGGYRNTMDAYRYAIEHDYRFYSYGDAMMIGREKT